MKKIINLFFAVLLIVFVSNKAFSENISGLFSNLIPGEGITEASIQINEDDNPDLEILAVRDISSGEFSNLFTQISLHTQEINNSDRLITNLGFGYRGLNDDKSSMFGINTFIDYDTKGHVRGSVGLEAKGAMLDLTMNSYHKLSNQWSVDGSLEQVLSGHEINLATQVPYMPWTKINWQNYYWEAEKASSDTEGNKLSLEMLLSPTVQFDATVDMSDQSTINDEYSYKLSFVYPPKENNKTLKDGMISDVAFEKENVEAKLKEKVRRSNSMVVEVQGSVIITSK
tara:strand:+ start:1051 stop:1905 length:855 start_codon:yes stop_codon:yes gene_type:complete